MLLRRVHFARVEYKLRLQTQLRAAANQWRRHGVDWGGHVHPTFARGRS